VALQVGALVCDTDAVTVYVPARSRVIVLVKAPVRISPPFEATQLNPQPPAAQLAVRLIEVASLQATVLIDGTGLASTTTVALPDVEPAQPSVFPSLTADTL
jgi:hypothetical protein